MAGYTNTLLWKKLTIKAGYRCYIYQSPENYFDLLEEIPSETTWEDDLATPLYDFIHAFVTQIDELETHWNSWKNALKKEGTLWISWPKGTSSIATNLTGNSVRSFGLEGGLVDVKVCAVDNDWSGLKFMYRKKDR